jgi:hypothetical protein
LFLPLLVQLHVLALAAGAVSRRRR